MTCVWLLALLTNLAAPLAQAATAPQSAAADARVSRKSAGAPPPASLAAPALVTVDAGDTYVVLEWTAVPGASGYRVYRSTVPGVWEAAPLARVTEPRYRNDGLTNGATYSYRVAAITSGGAGRFSNVVAAMPVSSPPVPAAALTDTSSTDAVVPVVPDDEHHATEKTSPPDAPGLFPFPASPMQGVPAARRTTPLPAPSSTPVSPIPAAGEAAAAKLQPSPASAPETRTPAATDVVSSKPQPAPPSASATPMTPAADVVSAPQPPPAPAPVSVTPAESGAPGMPAAAGVVGVAGTIGTSGPTPIVVVAQPPTAVLSPTDGPALPAAVPNAPGGLTVTAGDGFLRLAWTPVAGATGYYIYRGTSPNPQARLVVLSGVVTTPFVEWGLANGVTYYYRVTAVGDGGESQKSAEVSSSPVAPPAPPDPATVAAFRFLRQATWGPKPGDVEALKNLGVSGFLAQQLSAPLSTYPDTLLTMSIEAAQERFMELALTGPDQLRQRVAWAMHKIWVVSAVEVPSAPAIVTYHRLLLNGALGNYRDLMRDVTLNPAMGRYLNMLNNRSQAVTGSLPNENYARELMQLFTLGIPMLDQNGQPAIPLSGGTLNAYTEQDVKELARIFTGWTFGDGNPSTVPTNLGRENYKVPMEAVARFHDAGAKFFLGQDFPAGQTARQDLDQALDLLFNHPNVGPFVSRQLIQQLVTSNPGPSYVADVAAVFNDNGAGVRGDLTAVVTAILTHPEAGLSTTTSGKLSEPALFVVSQLRALNASVTDHPFMSDKAEAMGQKVLYPGSVFSYYSPGYRVRGTTGAGGPLGGPEFQILTAVTALERANFVGALVGGQFGADVAIDYTPFTSRASDAVALVDYCSLLFMGGRLSTDARLEIINAVRTSGANQPTERVRTALYLVLTAAQSQVDR